MENTTNHTQNSSKKENSKKIIILIVILLLLFAGIAFSRNLFFGGNSNTKDPVTPIETTNQNQNIDSSEELSAEEALRLLEEGEKIEVTGTMTAEIVSPEGEVFMPSQARMYEADITNFPKNASGECQWSFYLNQYDQEELYQEMTTPVIQDSCKFTSTFIANQGELRVEVRVIATDGSGGEIVAETIAEREYTVK